MFLHFVSNRRESTRHMYLKPPLPFMDRRTATPRSRQKVRLKVRSEVATRPRGSLSGFKKGEPESVGCHCLEPYSVLPNLTRALQCPIHCGTQPVPSACPKPAKLSRAFFKWRAATDLSFCSSGAKCGQKCGRTVRRVAEKLPTSCARHVRTACTAYLTGLLQKRGQCSFFFHLSFMDSPEQMVAIGLSQSCSAAENLHSRSQTLLACMHPELYTLKTLPWNPRDRNFK